MCIERAFNVSCVEKSGCAPPQSTGDEHLSHSGHSGERVCRPPDSCGKPERNKRRLQRGAQNRWLGSVKHAGTYIACVDKVGGGATIRVGGVHRVDSAH